MKRTNRNALIQMIFINKRLNFEFQMLMEFDKNEKNSGFIFCDEVFIKFLIYIFGNLE